MTKDEMKQIWAVLAMYRPRDRKLKDPQLKALWLETFQPFSYEEVRAAIVAHFRETRYFPHIPEITTRCTLPAGAGACRSDPGAGATRPQPGIPGEADRRAREDMERMRQFLRDQGSR